MEYLGTLLGSNDCLFRRKPEPYPSQEDLNPPDGHPIAFLCSEEKFFRRRIQPGIGGPDFYSHGV